MPKTQLKLQTPPQEYQNEVKQATKKYNRQSTLCNQFSTRKDIKITKIQHQKLPHQVIIYTGHTHAKFAQTAPELKELQLEICQLKEQISEYKALINSRDSLLQEVQEWKVRVVKEKKVYEEISRQHLEIFSQKIKRLDDFSANLDGPSVQTTHIETPARDEFQPSTSIKVESLD